MRRKANRRREVVVGPPSSVVESLEPRMLLALSASGGEFLVNTYTTLGQSVSAIAVDADGDFVVVWQSDQQDGSGAGIYGQRYNAAGVALGGEFLVNDTAFGGSQLRPAVAMAADGDFVIAWDGRGGGDIPGVFARRYSAAGVALGNEFRVNTHTPGDQRNAALAMDAAGNFVIAWDSSDQEGAANSGVYAQRYDLTGRAQGSEFHVNSITAGTQSTPAVAMDINGDFVIAWLGTDASGQGIRAQRYNAAGAVQGSEFAVNATTTENQTSPTVAMDRLGNFVIAWASNVQDGEATGVFAQRFNAAGATQGSEFQVNTYITQFQDGAAIAMDADGDFFIAWRSLGQDGSSFGIFARSFNAAGMAQGTEFVVPTTTAASQTGAAVAMDADGNAIVAWHGNGDGSVEGVYAQRFSESNPDIAPPILAGVFGGSRRVLPFSTHQDPLSQIVVSFSENISDAGGSGGANSVTNPANWLITRDGIDLTGTTTITYGLNVATNRYEAVLNLPGSYSSGNFMVMARANIRDAAGHLLDGNLDGSPGGNSSVPFSITPFSTYGSEFRVNTYTTDGQSGSAVAINSTTGDFVVVWQSNGQDGSGFGVYAQRYNSAGTAQGSEFRVNTYTTNGQRSPTVAMNSAGDFVVAWQSYLQDGLLNGIYAQRYNAAGVAQGSEFRVNTHTTNQQSTPAVAMNPAGDFVVAWQSNQDGSSYGIYAQRYNATGMAQGSEFKVNTYTTNAQSSPTVAMNSVSDFVVAWQSSAQDGNSFGIYAQRYNSAGTAQGSEFKANTYTTSAQLAPAVTMDLAGNFVVAWHSSGQDGPGDGIYAQRYDAAGVAQGAELAVNTYTTSSQFAAAVAMGPAGDFVITWAGTGVGDSSGVFAHRYDASGVAQGVEFRANTFTPSLQWYPSIAIDSTGDFVVTWQSDGQDGSAYGIYAQRFGIRATPAVQALQDAPDLVGPGNTLTLTAGDVSSSDGSVTSVSFYRETNGEPGLQVGAEGDTLVGTDTTESGGFWSIDIPGIALPAGQHTYWAQALDDAGLTGLPASTTNTISLGIVSAEFHYDTSPQKLKFTFNGDVSGSLGLDDIGLIKIGGGTVPALTMLSYGTDGTNVASFTMNTQLANGNYRATISAAGVTDGANPMAGDYTFDFFILGGDANHDRSVDARDLLILANNWFGSGKTWSQGDFTGDGLVNQQDLTVMAQSWQQGIPAPAPALPSQPVPTSARPGVRAPVRTPVRPSMISTEILA